MKSRITLFAFKSDRRNSKSVTYGKSTYNNGSTGAALKSKFTIDDIYDFIDWCCCQEYKRFNIVVVHGNMCVSSITNNVNTSSIEQIINRLYTYMKLLNMEDFQMTLSELHECPNIRYLINKYYNGGDNK